MFGSALNVSDFGSDFLASLAMNVLVSFLHAFLFSFCLSLISLDWECNFPFFALSINKKIMLWMTVG